MRAVPMFEKVNSLPGSQLHLTVHNKNRQMCGHHRRLDMGGHVIRPLVRVGQIGHRGISGRRHETRKEVLQVCLHLWISVFLDKQTARRVLDEQGQKPTTRHADLISKFV